MREFHPGTPDIRPALAALAERLGPMGPGLGPGLRVVWGRWAPALRALRPDPWLAVWLPQSVADEVDDCWRDAPAKAVWLDALAARLVMAGAELAAPQLAGSRCLGLPPAHGGLDAALAAAGLRRGAGGGLAQRYGLLTWAEPTGCGGCMLVGECVRAKG